MPKAIPEPTTTRRGVLAALTGAAFAGGGLALAMPTEGPAIPLIDRGADAELLAACAEYHRLHALWNSPYLSDDETDTRGSLRQAALERVAETPHTTLAGLHAKAAVAHSAMMFDVDTYLDRSWRDDATPEEIVTLDVLQTIAGEVVS